MRAAGVDAFEYLSARSQEEGIYVALFSPDDLSEGEPSSNNRWLCEASPDGVVFKEEGARSPLFFDAELFMTDGILPMPGYGDYMLAPSGWNPGLDRSSLGILGFSRGDSGYVAS